MKGDAVISEDGRYRYWLTRQIPSDNWTRCAFVMLNPSTATAEQDDPTIRRCIRFAERWGHSELVVVNLFALRSTDPRLLKADGVADPVGPENDTYLQRAFVRCDMVVCAWGAHGVYMDRGITVRGHIEREFREPLVFGLTKNGQPVHPLYQKGDATPHPWDQELVRGG